MLARLRDNQPPVRLSAHAVGCKVMNFREQGGWCGLSAQFLREHGVPSVEHWPEKSMSRSNDRPEVWANAALYKSEEYWIDLTKKVYDQLLSRNALATCLNNNDPCPIDLAAWGHSVCALRWVRVERGVFRPLILNSWKGWGRFGLAVLSGRFFDSLMGAVCLRTSAASQAA
jgi:hypothetical protein